jgi:pimeloyl-ACP methyl ester carboxylesterase
MVDVGGHKLRILRGGQGSPTVVFESGIGGNIDNWDTVVLAVNQITSTLGYSRAGTEPSEPASGPRTPLIVAEELHTLLANARIKPPYVLVGHSLGAVYVRVFTLKYPGEVVGLVLVDGSTERQFVAAHALDPNSPISTAPTEMPAAMKAALSPNVRSEMEGMIATNISGVLEVPGCLPDIPMVVLTSLQSPAPGVPEVDFMMKLKRQLQQDIFQSTTYGMLIVTKKSPHNIMRTEPDLVINAIRFVVGAARAPAS